MKRSLGTCMLIVLIALMLFAGCKKKDYKEVVHNAALFSKTVSELNNIIMGNNFTPVVSSRNYAYAAIAAYEVIAKGHPDKYQSLEGQLHGLAIVPAPNNVKNIDFEYAAILAYCKAGAAVTFPEGSMKNYVDGIKKIALDSNMPNSTIIASELYADKVFKAIMAWSKNDNYLKTRGASKYTISNIPGKWAPTPPMYADAIEPHWLQIRPMVMDSASQFKAPPPPVFNVTDKSSKYYEEVIRIKYAGEHLTPEQKDIADFWDDNPFKLNVYGHVQYSTKKFSPAGHWMGVTGIAAGQAKADFDETVYAYAKVSIAMFDAFIQCWDSKYIYQTARPETVINKYIDPEWTPHLQTPAFPEYTCGHSTISSAAAETLTSIFGDNFSYRDTTEIPFGLKTRSFPSFRAAAIENNWARFYGGIHFHNSCIISAQCGKQVGDLVINRLKMRNKKMPLLIKF